MRQEDIDINRASKTAHVNRPLITLQEAEERNRIAEEGLRQYFDNMVRDNETPCSQCRDNDLDACDDCEWYDYERVGSWKLTNDYSLLESEFERADEPAYPSDPLRYSEALEEWIIKGTHIPYVSGTDLAFIIDEYENYASFCFDYRFVGSKFLDDHQHSFAGVMREMMRDPEHFYIPKRAENQYSKQEVLFLELLREKMCADMGREPVCDIVCVRDEHDELNEENEQGERMWEMRVRQRIDEIKRERDEKRNENGKAQNRMSMMGNKQVTRMDNNKAIENEDRMKPDENIDEVLDDFPNQRFADAMKFYGTPIEKMSIEEAKRQLEEYEPMLRIEKKKRIDELSKEGTEVCVMGNRNIHTVDAAEFEAMTLEERRAWTKAKDRERAKERRRLREEKLAKYDNIPDEAWKAIALLTNQRQEDITIGRVSVGWHGYLDAEAGQAFFDDDSREEEYLAKRLLSHAVGVCVAKHSAPAFLWLYNRGDEYFSDWDAKQSKLVAIDPSWLEEENERGEAARYLMEYLDVVYDERIGDGYDYEVVETEEINKHTGQSFRRVIWVPKNLDDVSFPDEMKYLHACDCVSFLSDGVSAGYSDHSAAFGGTKKEVEAYKERSANERAMYGAYERTFNRGIFEYALCVDYLDEEERKLLDEISPKLYENTRLIRSLSDTFGYGNGLSGTIESLTNKMQTAVIAWDNLPSKDGWHTFDSIDEMEEFRAQHPRSITRADSKRHHNEMHAMSLRRLVESEEGNESKSKRYLIPVRADAHFEEITEEDERTCFFGKADELYEAIDNNASDEEIIALLSKQMHEIGADEIIDAVSHGEDVYDALRAHQRRDNSVDNDR